jgi:hypothetical protein
MNDNIEEYLARGEVNYLGKVDSVRATGGKERIRITWLLNSDPRIEDLRVYWYDMDGKRDSAVFPVDRGALDANGFMSVTLTDMPEGYYIFNLYHTGSKGYRSVGKEVTGKAYGSAYQATLNARRTKGITEFVDRMALSWEIPYDGETRSVLHYTAASGTPAADIEISPDNRTVLTDYEPDSKFTVTSYYLPEPDALDEFEVTSPEMDLKDAFVPTAAIELNKSSWSKKKLPGDISDSDYGAGYQFELLWDGNPESFWNATGGNPVPVYFTIDLGATARLGYHRLWHSDRCCGWGYYLNDHTRRWKVYAAETIKEDQPDAYWTGNDWKADWVLLNDECVVTKPSGRYDLPGCVTDADVDFARAGFRFDFDVYPPIRYVRFVVEEVWGETNDAVGIGELTFWGVVVE